MSIDAALTFDGIVTEEIRGATYRVTLENGHKVIAHAAGRLRKHRIRIVPADHVRVELSPYDLGQGRITFRLNNTQGHER